MEEREKLAAEERERGARERKLSFEAEDSESRPAAEWLYAAEGWECKLCCLRALWDKAAPEEPALGAELARLCAADGRKELTANACERETRER